MHLATQTNGTAPGPWLEDWILLKTERQRVTNKYPGLTQACDFLGKMGFCNPVDEGQNYSAPFTETGPRGEGTELGQKARIEVLKRHTCWDRKGSRWWIKRPATATSWSSPSLAAAVIPQILAFTFQCSVLARTGTVAAIHLLPQTADRVAHITCHSLKSILPAGVFE